MKKYLQLFVVSTFLLFSCGQHQRLREKADGDLNVQAIFIPATDSSDPGITFKVRVTPGKKWLEAAPIPRRMQLWYQVDSCFYLQRKGYRLIASLVQPVANGNSNNFEYLVQFNGVSGFEESTSDLIFNARFINGKDYTLR